MFLVAKALDEARDNGLPLHPGAERYWRELAYQIGRSPGPSSGTPDAPKLMEIETGVSVLKRSS